MKMIDCPPRDQLKQLLAEMVAVDDRDQLQAHIEERSACQILLEQMTAVDASHVQPVADANPSANRARRLMARR